jgi:hypothetical protein
MLFKEMWVLLKLIPTITVVIANRGIFFLFSMYCIQHCFICRPSDSAVSEDTGIELRNVATSALAVRRPNHSARSNSLVIVV